MPRVSICAPLSSSFRPRWILIAYASDHRATLSVTDALQERNARLSMLDQVQRQADDHRAPGIAPLTSAQEVRTPREATPWAFELPPAREGYSTTNSLKERTFPSAVRASTRHGPFQSDWMRLLLHVR